MIVAIVVAMMSAGCNRLSEVDAERLAEACKRMQEAGTRNDADALMRAIDHHSRVWQDIERERGTFLEESWKCGAYEPDDYIRGD